MAALEAEIGSVDGEKAVPKNEWPHVMDRRKNGSQGGQGMVSVAFYVKVVWKILLSRITKQIEFVTYMSCQFSRLLYACLGIFWTIMINVVIMFSLFLGPVSAKPANQSSLPQANMTLYTSS
ncbi:hypothetical protein POTOM_023334 [Populus tomentosa]|uniref:Uncharacterized protein n=1 Tax=Populus tomentosa TaxID=118781 RepID=A0A8X8CYY4_POPTO|nr:hypothetical protein POTOM_023334 [Populus tomentosa]